MQFPKHYPDIPKWKWVIKNTEISNRKKKWQKELFIEVWNEVSPYCTECWKYISEPKAHNFDHIKWKWLHSELKFDKSNLRILCFDCHYEKTNWWKYSWISFD